MTASGRPAEGRRACHRCPTRTPGSRTGNVPQAVDGRGCDSSSRFGSSGFWTKMTATGTSREGQLPVAAEHRRVHFPGRKPRQPETSSTHSGHFWGVGRLHEGNKRALPLKGNRHHFGDEPGPDGDFWRCRPLSFSCGLTRVTTRLQQGSSN